MLVRLATYINYVAKGDRVTLLSSGFQLSAESGTIRIMPEALNVMVITSNEGEARLQVPKISGAKAYLYQYSAAQPTPETVWVGENSLQRRHTFSRLKSEVRHWFRVVAIGPGGQVVYSDVVSKVIQ